MKKITPFKPLLFLMAMFFGVSFGFGQSIFTNPITGTNPNTSNPYTTGQILDPNITVSGVGRGTGITGTNANDRYNANNWELAFDSTDYFEFTLTPNATFEIDLISFVYTGLASGTGPNSFAIRSSIDGYTANIGTPVVGGATINLSGVTYQNITSAVTFRFYAWGATSGLGTFSINDFTFNGAVSLIGTCSGSTVTWTAGDWDNAGVGPSINTPVIIDDNFDTAINGDFSACSLVVNAPLIVTNDHFVEVENDVTNNSTITVLTRGNFVQNDSGATFTNIGAATSTVNKQTPPKDKWYFYTYWSSPVVGETIGNVFPDVDGDRRFSFNAANYIDANFDYVDDTAPYDWEYALSGATMAAGVGYATTSGRLGAFPRSDIANFTGRFNSGDISTGIAHNVANDATSGTWNLIGNPYPSAIDFVAFQAANASVIDGVAYFWSQASPPDSANPGNQQLNFSQSDYAMFTVGSGGNAGGGPLTPNQYIPSGQGFFVLGIDNNPVTFTNAMRMADGTSNAQFFKSSNIKNKANTIDDKLWVNLTSDNGVFNQILVAYVDGATNGNDGLSYDAPRILTSDFPATLYSTIESSNKKFAIQGKANNSLTIDEVIKLGFATNIDVATVYKFSIAQLQGNFLTGNTIYLKDNLLNKLHNLSASDYTFTSETGEFNNRFEIVFNANALSTNDVVSNEKLLSILELENDYVQFSVSDNLKIKSVGIFDLLGRQLYHFNGQNSTETYKLSNLKTAVYIAKTTLSNGAVITKKAIKK